MPFHEQFVSFLIWRTILQFQLHFYYIILVKGWRKRSKNCQLLTVSKFCATAINVYLSLQVRKSTNDVVGFILTHFVFLRAGLIFTRYKLWDFWYHTSSLRSMSPRSGRDIDHWLRQSSNIITFKTVLRICCRISGCSSSTWRNMSLGVGTPLRVFFPVKITVRYLKKKQHYPKQLYTNT